MPILNTFLFAGVRLGLERTRELLEKLGNPEKNLRFVHIAGTNGKGEHCRHAGRRAPKCRISYGVVYFPFLQVFNERMSKSTER